MHAWSRHVVVAAAVGALGGALLGLREGSLILWNLTTHVSGMADLTGFVARSVILHLAVGAIVLGLAGAVLGLLTGRWLVRGDRLVAVYAALFGALTAAMVIGWARSTWINEHILSDRFARLGEVLLIVSIGLLIAAAVALPGLRRAPRAHGAGLLRGAAWRAAAAIVVLLVLASVPLARLQALTVTRSAPAAPSTGEAAASERPNVLWVTLCTVRADHLSVYGYDRPTSPTLERLAARGIVFERAVSPSSWTRPSHASLFTGSYLSKHGVDTERQRIPAAALTFSEVVQRAGYQTVGVSNNYNAGTHVGLDRGFDLFVEVWGPLERSMLLHHWYDAFRERLFGERRNMCSARDTNRILATWFDRQHDPERPFFCFVNYAEGHDPYLPPDDEARAFLPEGVTLEAAQEYCRRAFIRHGKEVSSSVPLTREGLAVMQAMYDAELRYQDRRLGELLDDLERRGLLDNTLIVVVGDHGEHFGEHGLLGHENSLYEPLIHVPLIVCYSPLLPAGERVESLVQTTDIMPTSLALCGLEFPGPASQLQGRVLVTASGQLAPADDGANRAIAEFALTSEHPLRMLRENDWKLIDAAVDPDELYDLVRDPYEQDNLSTVESGRADRMAFDLETWSATSVAMTDEADEIELERDAIRMLKSLGYVGGD